MHIKFVHLKSSRAVIEGLLESLSIMFAENKAIESVLGAVAEAAHMALVWSTELTSITFILLL